VSKLSQKNLSDNVVKFMVDRSLKDAGKPAKYVADLYPATKKERWR
jgi:hypothetical protein